MTFEEIKSLDEQYVMHSYSRFPVAVDRGKGAVLWDMDGREYIDFTSGIGVTSLGHGDEGWLKAVTGQAAKLGHISNLFYTEPYARAARALCQGAGMSNAMFANSGAEANEAMIKLARKWSFDKYGKGRGTVITLHNSFHGRTITTLAATGQDKFHDYFFPFTEGFRYADANDMDSLEAVAGHDVCAVMLELVQGEGGVLPLDQDFVRKTADLCAKRDWLLLIDEVQTGVGRTGTLFAFQQYGLAPDVVSFAKGIAGGLPFGGVMANERCRDVFAPGTHGTTFGGNPIAAAAACHVLERMDEAFLAQVREKGDYLRAQVEELSLPCLGATRGLGLMIGVEVKAGWTNRELAARLIENGLLVLTAGPGLRFLPPLTITREEMDRGLAILKETLR
ncbi:MAG: aspartate aminotransferase family protein [Lawsonibacter sp.]|jgi:acetylornithine/N-succinyldiaminopimelate aminotransferase|nr:aspartate aminotransferase family protein [Lawsonibacter sp.]MCI9028362.1 aspartate aminotransferase family protein [Lawsonibacter sp.]MCI9656122.1 aspartate aminotransferase family protein [Lawsonibacter sp.]